KTNRMRRRSMLFAKPLPPVLKLIGILLPTLILISCTGSSSTRILPRQLPPAPDWAAPVHVSRPPAGTDLIEVAKREQNGRLKANSRLVQFTEWYEERRIEFAAD